MPQVPVVHALAAAPNDVDLTFELINEIRF